MSHSALGPQFQYRPPEGRGSEHLVTAHKEGERVGSLYFSPRSKEITGLVVRPEHRRQGLATGMLRHAQELGHDVQHSSKRTADGDAWAKTVADPAQLPARRSR